MEISKVCHTLGRLGWQKVVGVVRGREVGWSGCGYVEVGVVGVGYMGGGVGVV